MQYSFHMDLRNVTQPNRYYNMLYYNISLIKLTMKNVVFRSDYEFIKDIPYLTLIGELYFVKNYCYMEVRLYHIEP